MFKKAIINKILIVVLHVSGWAIIFLFPFLFFSRPVSILFSGPERRGYVIYRDSVPEPPQFEIRREPPPADSAMFRPPMGRQVRIDPQFIFIESLATNLLLVLFFYANVYFLVPGLLSRRGWWWYVPAVVFAFFLYLSIGYGIRLWSHPNPIMLRPPFFMGSINFLFIFSLSLAFRLMQDKGKVDREKKELENEQLKSELSFLRSQVSPHFMFNVLNSLASLARKKSDELEPMIIQLSQLMRYSLYQNGDRRVNLGDEVHYLENYINLQKLRYGRVAEIEFSAEIQNAELNIEPMLLIPFVENAFKHGIGVEGRPIILVILRMTDFTLHFMVKNKFNPVSVETKDSSSGIGLQNVRRRLNLLYKDMHELHTYTTGDGWFVAELKLILR